MDLGELDRQLYEYMQAKLITQREAKLMHEEQAVFRRRRRPPEPLTG